VTSGRVYLPVSPAILRAAAARGGFGPAPLRGHAVTELLGELLPDSDEEQREYVALTAAAADALALVEAGGPAQRVVAAVDVARWEPVTAAEEAVTAVSVVDEVGLRRLAAVLVDSPDAASDVAAARDAGADERLAEQLAERCLDHELGWYAAQELDDLLDGWSTPEP
jgi:hypothetical protein